MNAKMISLVSKTQIPTFSLNFPNPQELHVWSHKNSTPVDRKWGEETQNEEKSGQSHAIAILGIVAMFTW